MNTNPEQDRLGHNETHPPTTGYLGPTEPTESIELYDPKRLASVDPVKLEEYFTVLVPSLAPKHVYAKNSILAGDNLSVTTAYEEVSPHIGVSRSVNRGTVLNSLRKAIREQYMANVVDITLRRRKEDLGETTRQKITPDTGHALVTKQEQANSGFADPKLAPIATTPEAVEGELIDQPKEASVSAIQLARLGVTRARRKLITRRVQNLEERRTVMRETTDAIINGRPIPVKTRPITARQQRAAEKASRTKRKAAVAHQKARSLAQTYGAGEDLSPDPKQERPPGTMIRGPYFMPGDTVLPAQQLRLSDLGSPEQKERLSRERATRTELLAELRAAEAYRGARGKHRASVARNEAQREGRNFRGKREERRLKNARQRLAVLDDHIKTLGG